MGLTGYLFIAIFGSGLLMTLVRSPLYGLLTYIAVFYLDPPSRWWGSMLPDLRWSLIAALVTLLATWRLPKDRERPPWFSNGGAMILILYTLWLWIQYMWALAPEEHFELAILFTKYVILFYVMYRLLDSEQKITWFLLAHVVGCLYLGWLGFTSTEGGRLEGVGGPGINDANSLAMHMGTGILVGAMLILGLRGWQQYLVFFAMPFMLNTLVLAGSRGAFLGVLTGGLMLVWLKPNVHRRMFWAFAVLGVLLFGMLAPQSFWERMGTITATVEQPEEVDGSTETRLVLFKAQWKMFEAYPFGSGHRGTAVLSRKYLETRYLTTTVGTVEESGARSSHNTFMTALVEQGIPGALLFFAMIVWVFANLRRLRAQQKVGISVQLSMQTAAAGAAVAVVLVAGIFTDYIKAEVQIWMYAIIAALWALARRRQPARAPVAVGGASAIAVSGPGNGRAGNRAPTS